MLIVVGLRWLMLELYDVVCCVVICWILIILWIVWILVE